MKKTEYLVGYTEINRFDRETMSGTDFMIVCDTTDKCQYYIMADNWNRGKREGWHKAGREWKTFDSAVKNLVKQRDRSERLNHNTTQYTYLKRF